MAPHPKMVPLAKSDHTDQMPTNEMIGIVCSDSARDCFEGVGKRCILVIHFPPLATLAGDQPCQN